MGRTKRVAVLVGVVIAATLGVVVWAAMHDSSVKRSSNQLRDDWVARAIAQALDLYADRYNDDYPDRDGWSLELVQLGMIEQGFDSGYEVRYVGGDRTLDIFQAVFFVASKETPGIAHVGFADGSVRAVDLDEARAMIE